MDGAEHNETQPLDELLARLQGCMAPHPDLLQAIERAAQASDAQTLARIQFMCDMEFGRLSGLRPGGESAYGLEIYTLMKIAQRVGRMDPADAQAASVLLGILRDRVNQLANHDDTGAP